MLLEMTVANFRSIREPVTLSLVATPRTERDPALNEGPVRLLPTGESALTAALLYGANASGKSNVLAALKLLGELVLRSAGKLQEGDPLPVDPYRFHTDSREAPTSIEVVFVQDDTQFRYGVELTQARVLREWLYRRVKREALQFERTGQSLDIKSAFSRSPLLATPPRENALLLSEAVQRGVPEFKPAFRWFERLTVVSGPNLSSSFSTLEVQRESPLAQHLRSFLSALDLGLGGIQVEMAPFDITVLPTELREAFASSVGDSKVPRIRSLHPVYDATGEQVGVATMPFDETESIGTQQLFALSGPVLHTLVEGRVLLIDEFGDRLHPLLALALWRLFQSRATNPRGAQLIVATHVLAMLDPREVRRDQVWFTEKTRRGETRLIPLIGYKPRNDASIDQDYLRGRYGGIPSLGNIAALFQSAPSTREA